MSIKGFSNSAIQSYLTDKIYYIPDYQREYSWEEEQLDDFWQDLTNAIEEHRSHFFGQVVVHNDSSDGKNYIIDGQQRTTTVVIMLAALRDWFNVFANDDDEAHNKVEDIRLKFLGRYSDRKNELRLHLGISDRAYFRDNIQRANPHEEAVSPSQKRIAFAYKYFTDKLSALVGKKSDTTSKVDALLACYETLLDNFSLIVVTTDDINEAFIIFETLNARGKELETADLLKNYIFMKSGANIEIVKNKWAQMLDSLNNRDEATKFIRYFWNSCNKFAREKNLYKQVSSQITTSSCEAFVTGLADLAELYNALVDPYNSPYFADSEITDTLANLATMNATTYYPLAFALVKCQYSEEDIKAVLLAVETLSFRNFVVAGWTANKYELIFAQIALCLSNGEYMIEDVIRELRSNTIDNDGFARALIGLEIRRVPVAKYVLREIEDYNNPEKRTSRDNKAINLEHIMPKNNTQWRVPTEFHDQNLYRLANQTIMLDEYNKSASNKVFSVKKENYYRSQISLTRALVEYPTWDLEALQKREEQLIEVIKLRWALS